MKCQMQLEFLEEKEERSFTVCLSAQLGWSNLGSNATKSIKKLNLGILGPLECL